MSAYSYSFFARCKLSQCVKDSQASKKWKKKPFRKVLAKHQVKARADKLAATGGNLAATDGDSGIKKISSIAYQKKESSWKKAAKGLRRASSNFLNQAATAVAKVSGGAIAGDDDEEDEGGVSNDDRIRIMNQVKAGTLTIDEAAGELAMLEENLKSPPSSAPATPTSSRPGSRRGSLYSPEPALSPDEQMLVMMRVASGEISKEEAENIIAGAAVYADEEFDEPEYGADAGVMYSSRSIAGGAAASSPKKKKEMTPEQIAAKQAKTDARNKARAEKLAERAARKKERDDIRKAKQIARWKKKLLKKEAEDNAAKVFKVGDEVDVKGYPCKGIIRFIGEHKADATKGARILIQLHEPLGKNNGTVGGHKYCDELPENTGCLCAPYKVTKEGVNWGPEETGADAGEGDAAAAEVAAAAAQVPGPTSKTSAEGTDASSSVAAAASSAAATAEVAPPAAVSAANAAVIAATTAPNAAAEEKKAAAIDQTPPLPAAPVAAAATSAEVLPPVSPKKKAAPPPPAARKKKAPVAPP